MQLPDGEQIRAGAIHFLQQGEEEEAAKVLRKCYFVTFHMCGLDWDDEGNQLTQVEVRVLGSRDACETLRDEDHPTTVAIRKALDANLPADTKLYRIVAHQPKDIGADSSAQPAATPGATQMTDKDGTAAPPDWVPKKEETIRRWRESYEAIIEVRDYYSAQYDDWDGDEPAPSMSDYKDAVAKIFGRHPSDKTIRRIIKAGDNGWV